MAVVDDHGRPNPDLLCQEHQLYDAATKQDPMLLQLATEGRSATKATVANAIPITRTNVTAMATAYVRVCTKPKPNATAKSNALATETTTATVMFTESPSAQRAVTTKGTFALTSTTMLTSTAQPHHDNALCLWLLLLTQAGIPHRLASKSTTLPPRTPRIYASMHNDDAETSAPSDPPNRIERNDTKYA